MFDVTRGEARYVSAPTIIKVNPLNFCSTYKNSLDATSEHGAYLISKGKQTLQ